MTDREKALEAAARAMLDRWILYCGGDDLPHAGHTDLRLIEQARAALAMPATVDRAIWTPPEDRPDGYVCLGLVPVTWHGEVMGWRDSGMEQVDPLGFAPAPEDAP
jgi:hypothetical protein